VHQRVQTNASNNVVSSQVTYFYWAINSVNHGLLFISEGIPYQISTALCLCIFASKLETWLVNESCWDL